MISLFGPGFVGGRFAEMYPTFTHIEKRDEKNVNLNQKISYT